MYLIVIIEVTMLFVIFWMSLLSNALAFPSTIHWKQCSKSDPQVQKCIKEGIQESLTRFRAERREMNTDDYDPLFIPNIHIQISSSSLNVEVKWTNNSLYGISSTKVLDVNFDFEKCHLFYKGYLHSLRLIGHYEVKGKFMILTFNGHGLCNSTLNEVTFSHDLTCTRYKKKGETYLRTTDYKLSVDAKYGTFHFEDLFYGNPKLSEELLRTVNDNQEFFFNELKPGLEATFADLFKKRTNQFFARYPERIIFLD